MKTHLYIIVVVLFYGYPVLSQPSPFDGTLLFNLTEDENTGKLITPDEIQSKDIRFFTFQDYNKKAILRYDTIQKAFSIKMQGFESKQFGIIYKSDTVYIDYPSVSHGKSVCIQAPIPLQGKSYSFFNWNTYDAMYNNCKYNNLTIFYFCSWGALHNYEMQEQTNKKLKKRKHTKMIELEK